MQSFGRSQAGLFGETSTHTVKSRRMTVLIMLLMASVGSLLLGTAPEAKAQSITLAKLAGPWQIAFLGNTGCGASSMRFSRTMNASGVATGVLSGSSTGCPSGSRKQRDETTGFCVH